MEERPPSQTARTVAVWRALHLLRDPEPKIFEDIFARGLAGYDTDEDMFRWVGSNPGRANPNLPSLFALRHRYTEDRLRMAISVGARQYVILGAGLDSFAFRHPEIVAEVDVFEVDHPASQRWKRNRVAHLGLIVPDRLHYVPIDFEAKTLTRGLMEARLDPSRPTFFSCLGVTQYLTPEGNLDLLNQVSRLTVENTITLEFNPPPETLSPEDAAVMRGGAERAAAVGEPWLSFFKFDQMEAVLRQCGFDNIKRFGAAEATSEYALAQPLRQIPGYFRMITATSSGNVHKSCRPCENSGATDSGAARAALES